MVRVGIRQGLGAPSRYPCVTVFGARAIWLTVLHVGQWYAIHICCGHDLKAISKASETRVVPMQSVQSRY